MTVTYRDGWLTTELGGSRAVEAVALATLPALPDELDGAVRSVLFPAERPRPLSVINTALGRIGLIVLPSATSDVYTSARLVPQIGQALAMAHRLGAPLASLTGLIPSATDYGRALDTSNGAPVTTGHATTVCAVVLAVEAILAAARRRIENESLAVVGVGSIGSSALRLLLEVASHPAEIVLCDLFQARSRLEALAAAVRDGQGFRGRVRIACSEVPEEAYASRVIIGATNVAGVLDVARLRPGTVIVDDSAPHCFDVAAATARFADRGDILFTEGGLLRTPWPLAHEVFLPGDLHRLARRVFAGDIDQLLFGEREIMGCVLSGLLSVELGLPTTVGAVRPEEAAAHFWALRAEGFGGAELQCGGRHFDASDCARFVDSVRA